MNDARAQIFRNPIYVTEIASIINADDILIRCNNPECEKVFVLDKISEQLCECHFCGKKYYVLLRNPELYVKSIPSQSKR